MPPQPSTSSPASFGGNARPTHVSALSGKVQGLKFMQRAAALNPPPSPPTPSSSTTPPRTHHDTSTPATTTLTPKFVSEDGNEEHWTFANPTAATVTQSSSSTQPSSSSAGSGWNSWLLQAAASSSSSKGKHRDGKSSQNEPREGTLAPIGRRTFGTFEGHEKRAKNEVHPPNGKDTKASTLEAGPKRENGKKRPSSSRDWSLEPDLQEEVEEAIRQPAKAKEEKEPQTLRRSHSGGARYHQGGQSGAKREKKKSKKEKKHDGEDPRVSPRPWHPPALVDYMATSDEDASESDGDPDPHIRMTTPAAQAETIIAQRKPLPAMSFSPSPNARQFSSEKIVPGEWLCHVRVDIPLQRNPRLHKMLQTARKRLEGKAANRFTWLTNEDVPGDKDSLHVSLTQPVLVRGHEQDSFVRETKAVLEQQKSFALSFSSFTPFLSTPLTSIHPPRIYYTLEVGQGHSPLSDMSKSLNQVIKTFFQGKTYFEEQGARFHASFAFEQVAAIDAHVRQTDLNEAKERCGLLEEEIGDMIRDLGEIRVRAVEIQVGKKITRVALR